MLTRRAHETGHHRLHAVRAHLLEMSGNDAAALAAYRQAADHATNDPEQRYLAEQAARLATDQQTKLIQRQDIADS